MVNRRQFITGITTASTIAIAGCSSGGGGGSGDSGPEESGITSSDVTHNFDVEEGETIRIEVDNQEGVITVTQIVGPNGDNVAGADVETQDTITHTAEESGVYQVFVNPSGTGSYEIYIE